MASVGFERNIRTPSTTSMMELPTEILREVICRLPASTIMQFSKSTSLLRNKEFHDIVSDDHFPHLFETYSSFHPYSFLAHHDDKIFLTEYNPNDDDITSTELSMDFVKGNGKERIKDFVIMGSCNGWFLVKLRREDFHLPHSECLRLVNPITRRCLILPDPNTHESDDRYSFGYSKKTGYYKVFKFGHTEYQVITVGSNSDMYWRRIKVDDIYVLYGEFIKEFLGYANCDTVLLNGALHLLVYKKSAILKFDIDKEEFELVSTPYNQDEPSIFLGVLQGCLCLGVHTFCNGLEIWTMKEYEREDSWSRVTCIHNFNLPDPFELISVLDNGKMIFISYHKQNKLHVYDPRNEQWEEKALVVPGIDERRRRLAVVQVVPSFLCLKKSPRC